MRAKEYAEQFVVSPTIETLRSIMNQFLEEAAALEEKRSIKTMEGVFSLFDECDQKWRAFCRLVPDEIQIKPLPDGFSNLLKEVNPKEYSLWQISRQIKRHTQNRRIGGRQRL